MVKNSMLKSIFMLTLFVILMAGIIGVGQSSWGPTGFGLIADATQGRRILDELRGLWPATKGLEFELRRGRNFGAEVEPEKAIRAAP